MSNLGWYQFMTTAAKKVGGPKKFLALLVSGGAVLGGGSVLGGQAIVKKVKKSLDKKQKEREEAIVYSVYIEGKSNEGLLFSVGDTFKVLEVNGDAVLIEKVGDENNPYFVSGRFLKEISDYRNRG